MEQVQQCMVCQSTRTEPYLQCRDHLVSGEVFQLVRCLDCGFVFLYPRPAEGELSRYYLSEEYHSHAASGFSPVKTIYRLVRAINIRRKFRIVSRAVKGKTILDIGCGTGDLLAHFQRKSWSVHGVEPSEKARTYAQEINKVEVKESLDGWDFTAGSLHAITLWHVLEHIPDVRALMIRLSQLLHDEGKVFIALPNLDSADAKVYAEYWAAYDLPRHLHHFSPVTFQLLARQTGWQIIQITPMKFDAYYISMLSEKHRSGNGNLFRALVNGYQSNRKGLRNIQNYSSLIYILQKKTSPEG